MICAKRDGPLVNLLGRHAETGSCSLCIGCQRAVGAAEGLVMYKRVCGCGEWGGPHKCLAEELLCIIEHEEGSKHIGRASPHSCQC